MCWGPCFCHPPRFFAAHSRKPEGDTEVKKANNTNNCLENCAIMAKRSNTTDPECWAVHAKSRPHIQRCIRVDVYLCTLAVFAQGDFAQIPRAHSKAILRGLGIEILNREFLRNTFAGVRDAQDLQARSLFARGLRKIFTGFLRKIV